LQGDRAVPAFKPPFDIIYRIAQEARAYDTGQRIGVGTNKQAEGIPSACPTLLPLLDELRTYCYENRIEEVPAFLTA